MAPPGNLTLSAKECAIWIDMQLDNAEEFKNRTTP